MQSPNKSNKKSKQQKVVRQAYQKKPIRKGKKSLRGQPELYDEIKKIVSIGITPTAVAGLDRLSQEHSVSRSELIERIGRQIIQLKVSSHPSSEIRTESNQVQKLDQTLCT